MNLKELLKKREKLAAQSVEAKLQELDAQIAQAQAEEAAKAEQERQVAHEAALADARGVRDAAQEAALERLRAFTAAVAELEAAEDVLRGLGAFRPTDESTVPLAIRKEARRTFARLEERERMAADAAKNAVEAAEWAALSAEERRRRVWERDLEHALECRERAAKAGRDHDVTQLNAQIRTLREELGIKPPLGERIRSALTPDPEAVRDEALLAQSQAWHEVGERLRAKERAKAAEDDADPTE